MENNKKNLMVLVVDDDPLITRMYQAKLTLAGFDVVIASDGGEAFSVAEKNKPDLILLDLMMPKINGIEALKILKKSPETKSIPVIILTNLTDNGDDITKAKEMGAHDYLVKSQLQLKVLPDIVKAAVKG